MSAEGPIVRGRYRIEARWLPFTPSWFWEVIDTRRSVVVENSLAFSRALYASPADALVAGLDYLEGERQAA